MSISRRSLLKATPWFLSALLTGGTTAGVTAVVTMPERDPRSLFIDLHSAFPSPDLVLDAFANANTDFLMATYGVFFPKFIIENGSTAPERLRKELLRRGRKVEQNQHRADALPAVAAVHLLTIATSESEISRLSGYIVEALEDDRREVKEIVLQNLTASTAPNFDVVRFFKVSEPVIQSVVSVLTSAADKPQLMNPSILALEFLLNARVLLRGQEGYEREVAAITRGIELSDTLFTQNNWFHSAMKRAHEHTFRVATTDPRSLPPQASEGLIGWKNLPVARDYFAVHALSRVKLAKECVDIILGDTDESKAMSIEEARIALPKILDFIDTYDLTDLIKNSAFQELAEQKDPAFYRFLKRDFWSVYNGRQNLLKRAKLMAMEQKEARELGDLVPFSQYHSNQAMEALRKSREDSYERAVFGAVLTGGSAAITANFMNKEAIKNILNWFLSRKERKNLTKPQRLELLNERVSDYEKRIDNGEFLGVEEQQRNLGDVPDSLD